MSLGLATAAPAGAEAPAPDMRRCRPLLGGFVEIAADDPAAIEAGFAAVARVQALMSPWEPGSDLVRINRHGTEGPAPLHAWTRQVLSRALFWAAASGGLFDPTIGGRLQKEGLLPRHLGQPEADPGADWRDVDLSPEGALLRRPCVLDLCGIAKGFAVDKAIAAMEAAGARRGLVNAGGDLRAFGGSAWTVHLPEPASRQPIARFGLCDAAAATSAVLPGRRGARHLPRRAKAWTSATVVARTAMDADALTKVVLGGGPKVRSCLHVAQAHAFRLDRGGRWERLG